MPKIKVEVVYALPEQQSLLELEIEEGATVKQAIEASGILEQFTEIDLEQTKVGIFSRACKLDQIIKAGERVEIYRPLLIDPKEKRRQRAKNEK